MGAVTKKGNAAHIFQGTVHFVEQLLIRTGENIKVKLEKFLFLCKGTHKVCK